MLIFDNAILNIFSFSTVYHCNAIIIFLTIVAVVSNHIDYIYQKIIKFIAIFYEISHKLNFGTAIQYLHLYIPI